MVGRPGPVSASAEKKPSSSTTGPTECASRDRAEDAADAVKDMATILNTMDPDTVKRLVHAREAAAGVYKAFPEGDRRFDSIDSESDDDQLEIDDDDQQGEGSPADAADLEGCRGLFDDKIDNGPRACLMRAKDEHGFDVVAEMDQAKLDFFERIRFVNYIRRIVVNDGVGGKDTVAKVRAVLNERDDTILADEKLLEPVIEGDLILTVLESEEDLEDSTTDKTDDVIDAVQESLRASHILP